MSNTERSDGPDGTPQAVIYAAKSTADIRGSIPTQIADCEAMAEREGWTIADRYWDEAFSAFHGNRGPGLVSARERAAAIAAAGEQAILVAQHSDRFARGDGQQAQHLVDLFRWAQRASVKLRSVQDDQTFTNIVLTAVMGERNVEDSRRKGLAVKAGMRRRAARGKLSGGPRPYGYEWVVQILDGRTATKRLHRIESEAEVVRRIFEDSVAGVSQMTLARSLTEEGVPTVKGGDWLQATVRRILANVLYKGLVRHGDEVFPGEHDPIVSEELWEAARAVREAAARTKGHTGGRTPRGNHLFTNGLLRCGLCGSALIPRTMEKRRGGLYEVYLCDGRRRLGASYCARKPLDRVPVDALMLAELADDVTTLEATRERIIVRLQTDASVAHETLGHAWRDDQRAEARYQRVLRDYQDHRITAEDWSEQRPILRAEREAARAAVERATEHAARLADAHAQLDADDLLYEKLRQLREALRSGLSEAPNLNALRRLLHTLFVSVTAIADDSGRVELRPVVRWDSVREADGEFRLNGRALPIGTTEYEGLPLDSVVGALFGAFSLDDDTLAGHGR